MRGECGNVGGIRLTCEAGSRKRKARPEREVVHDFPGAAHVQEEKAVAYAEIDGAATKNVMDRFELRRNAGENGIPAKLSSAFVQLLQQERNGRLCAGLEIGDQLRAVVLRHKEIMFLGNREAAFGALQRKGEKAAVSDDAAVVPFEQSMDRGTCGALFSPAPEFLNGHAITGQSIVFGENPVSFRRGEWTADYAEMEQ